MQELYFQNELEFCDLRLQVKLGPPSVSYTFLKTSFLDYSRKSIPDAYLGHIIKWSTSFVVIQWVWKFSKQNSEVG